MVLNMAEIIAVTKRMENTSRLCWVYIIQIRMLAYLAYLTKPCLFNLCAEYIMWNASLDEAQAGIKISARNINNLKYADDTTFMAENQEEVKSLLMKLKEESEKAGLIFNIQKTKIMTYDPITSW